LLQNRTEEEEENQMKVIDIQLLVHQEVQNKSGSLLVGFQCCQGMTYSTHYFRNGEGSIKGSKNAYFLYEHIRPTNKWFWVGLQYIAIMLNETRFQIKPNRKWQIIPLVIQIQKEDFSFINKQYDKGMVKSMQWNDKVQAERRK
jgi:hypothetical protein